MQKHFSNIHGWLDKGFMVFGAVLTVKDVNDTACDDNATEFARKHACAAWRL